MDKKKVIKIICAVGSAVLVFTLTRFLGFMFIRNALGYTSYAVSAPLMLPLELLASIAAAWLFVPSNNREEYIAEDELTEDPYVFTESKDVNFPTLDESAYPELFKSKADIPDEESISTSRPDIAKIIREQGGEIEAAALPEEKKDLLGKIKEDSEPFKSLYDDIPDTLPEGYSQYEYEDDEETDEEYEEYEIPRIPPLALKLATLFITAVLAVILPLNTSTIYTPDSITIKRPFITKEYRITDANHYTIGVKLSGDISMKVHFDGGFEKELIIPSTVMISDSFSESFSSEYAYAAFCNRLLEHAEVDKRFDKLNSLSPSPSASEDDIAYIEEIAETKLDLN